MTSEPKAQLMYYHFFFFFSHFQDRDTLSVTKEEDFSLLIAILFVMGGEGELLNVHLDRQRMKY